MMFNFYQEKLVLECLNLVVNTFLALASKLSYFLQLFRMLDHVFAEILYKLIVEFAFRRFGRFDARLQSLLEPSCRLFFLI